MNGPGHDVADRSDGHPLPCVHARYTDRSHGASSTRSSPKGRSHMKFHRLGKRSSRPLASHRCHQSSRQSPFEPLCPPWLARALSKESVKEVDQARSRDLPVRRGIQALEQRHSSPPACKLGPSCRIRSLAWDCGYEGIRWDRALSDVVVVRLGGQPSRRSDAATGDDQGSPVA